ncbi:MAG TPA: hypothetical protein VN131_06485, partial [Mobilitalea sp.]|nr:hypothetical protein [Mobilitalea sp.]
MNKVKKVINPHTAKQPINYMVWIVTSIVLVVALIGGVLFDQLYQRPILTINGDKYTMNDLRYYFYTIESQYDYFNQALGGNYWDTKYDEQSGKTMREVAKQDAIDTSLYTEVLYKDAMKKGYKLTADEQKTIATNVKNLLDQQIPKVTANKNGFTTAYLTKVLDKATIIDRYRKDVIKTFNIDEAKITAGVSKEDNRQYDLEYLFISTKKTDDQGKSVDMTADEKTAAYNKINGIYDKALTT